MNSYDLELALYKRLTALAPSNTITLRPDEIFDAESASSTRSIRRGVTLLSDPQTVAFGDGVYSRGEHIYQIDIWTPRAVDNAFKTLKGLSDQHVTQFWPANNRGLSLTESQTTAHITRRPAQRHLGREGAYLRDVVEVSFHVDN